MLQRKRTVVFGMITTLVLTTVVLIAFRANSAPSLPEFRMESLHQLMRFQGPEILEHEYQQLIDEGVGIDDLDDYGHTALFHAVFHDNPISVNFILEKGADPNLCDPRSNPPIVWASRGIKPANLPIVQALIDAGVDVNVCDPKQGRTPLHCAALTGHLEIVRVLIAAGADVNAVDTHSHSTPLQYAVAYGRCGTADLLLSHGADPELRNDQGFRPIDQINACRYPETIQSVFRAHGVDDQRRPEMFKKYAVTGE